MYVFLSVVLCGERKKKKSKSATNTLRMQVLIMKVADRPLILTLSFEYKFKKTFHNI